MKRFLIPIFLALSTMNGFSCDCEEGSIKVKQELAIKTAKTIAIVDVLEVNPKTGNYVVEIVEVLRGELKSRKLNGGRTSSCSGLPTKGRWIMYFDKEGNKISYSICGLSRSFDNPDRIYVKEYTYPIPSENEKPSTEVSLDLALRKLKIQEGALRDLRDEIAALKKMR